MAVPSRVEQESDGGWRLIRGGSPLFVDGVGGTCALQRAAELGANSCRTWSANELGSVLDDAHKAGLSVCAGLFVKKAATNRAFYEDAKHSAERAAKLREYVATVAQFKEHPALLCWAIGNEANADGGSDCAALFAFLQAAALAVKAEDAAHFTMVVTTSPTPELARGLASCPAVVRALLRCLQQLSMRPA